MVYELDNFETTFFKLYSRLDVYYKIWNILYAIYNPVLNFKLLNLYYNFYNHNFNYELRNLTSYFIFRILKIKIMF